MIIKGLNIANLRAYKVAEFKFQPGMNLLVGVNGVGKTTLLEALRVCLSQIQPEISISKNRKENFAISDIRIGTDSLQVSCDFEIEKQSFNLLIHKQRELIRIKDTENIREQIEELSDKEVMTPSIKGVFPNASKSDTQSLGIFFSTRRSLMVDREPGRSASIGGQGTAFSDALSANREFNLRIFAEWFKVQEILGEENSNSLRNIKVLKDAVCGFLPGFSDLKVVEIAGEQTFSIVKNKTILNIKQLSDGERGVLSLVLDISRRLSQANPKLNNPLKDGKAIVLIDELDLHLHPKWQYSIIENLIKVFPSCQFIATTHSPQMISSLDVDNIYIIDEGNIFKPDKSLGMDTNWVLKYIMDGEDRLPLASEAIDKVENLILDLDFDAARQCIQKYIKEGLDISEWTIFEARMSNLEILGEGE
ncbi:putative ATP-binding protein involved in virulence [Flavobacterium sp. 9]|uniref:AAA family ATPase n=1 Tax=Flavobacterium sp. 9 TaxID=2035198 RepID=UPI000C19C788|nr:AAA family ATPase [Flavobacterium sp. 9]PIF34540.1 putative ATP-binding protein involved in virulence [Flavobacterium sp. 9]